MGIVRKQSIASSIYIYIGFVIGAFNVLYLFPKYLTPEQFGLTRLLQDVAMLIAMFCTFGSCPAVLKFYPFYNRYLPNKKNDLPQLTVITTFLGCILFLLLTPVFKDDIIRKFGERSPLFVQYFYLLYPLTISYAFWYLFEASSWSIQKTVLPNFLKEIGFRLLTTFFVLLFVFKLINFNAFANLFSFIYLLPIIVLFYYLLRNNYFSFNFSISTVTKRLWKQIVVFSLFVFSGQFLNVVARTIDTIVLSSQSTNGLADAAVFTVATYLVTLMDVPMRGMTGIASSVIAYAWRDKDMMKIKEIYQKTALNLVIAGLGIWCVLMLNAESAVIFFGDKYNGLIQLLIILGAAKLFDLGTGLNAQILLSSKYWKIDFITSMCFVVISVPLNIILVKKYALVGSAYANIIAILFYNLTRFIIIYKLFKLQPFSIKNAHVLIIGLVSFIPIYLLPSANNIFITVLYKTVIFLMIYSTAILKLKISEDFNDLFKTTLVRIKKNYR
jgi:O-antigen/teichoic acid export membrane protein